VEEILDAGKPYHYGIEVGSKPEIFAGLSVHSDNESLIVCNGYKDDTFIRTALIGRKLGKKVILIAEKLGEVRSIVRIAKEMNVEPSSGCACASCRRARASGPRAAASTPSSACRRRRS
jgi:arginine decarboxylase